MKPGITYSIALAVCLALLWLPMPRTSAADHRDGPILGNNLSVDLDDVYIFLDPNNNSRVILAFDLAGPIIPPENANAGVFDSSVSRAVANFSTRVWSNA